MVANSRESHRDGKPPPHALRGQAPPSAAAGPTGGGVFPQPLSCRVTRQDAETRASQ